ncbi:hypothetical protein, partial [Neorhizobium galegae]|uniref:hypothetical protein n=1 Tax=Neorhizobium galegae TaxID=399 RepID=UPI002106CB11
RLLEIAAQYVGNRPDKTAQRANFFPLHHSPLLVSAPFTGFASCPVYPLRAHRVSFHFSIRPQSLYEIFLPELLGKRL